MSSPLRSCEEDEGMVVNSEGGDFDEEDDDEGDPDENASDINSPAAPRETATPAAPGTVKKEEKLADKLKARTRKESRTNFEERKGHVGSSRNPQFVPQISASLGPVRSRRRQTWCARRKNELGSPDLQRTGTCLMSPLSQCCLRCRDAFENKHNSIKTQSRPTVFVSLQAICFPLRFLRSTSQHQQQNFKPTCRRGISSQTLVQKLFAGKIPFFLTAARHDDA